MVGISYFAFCILEVPRVRYLTELGATAFDFGVIASLASLVIVFQVVSGMLTARIRRRKPVWMAVCISHRLLFALVLAAPFLFEDQRWRIWWIIGVLFVHDALAQLSAPMWLSWMADLLPPDSLNRMWGVRLRAVTAAQVAASVIAALVIGYFEGRDQVILGFTILAAVGILAGVADILLFIPVPEPPNECPPDPRVWKVISQPLRDRTYRPFFVFMLYWHFAMMLAAPFFTVYMISSLRMPALQAQLINTGVLVGQMLASPFWGHFCDVYGVRPAIQLSLTLKTFTIFGFIVVPPIPAVYHPAFAVILVLDGMMNAGLALGMQGAMLQASPRQNRAMYIATVNFLAVGLAGIVSPLVGGTLIDLAPGAVWPAGAWQFNFYHVVFALSVLVRLGAIPLAARIPSHRNISTGDALRDLLRVNPITVLILMRRLRTSRNEAVRARAARRLGELRPVLAVSTLIGALRDPSRPVRHAAATALGRIGTAEATASLAGALVDARSGVHTPAALALGRIGSFEALRALLANLTRPDPTALRGTIDALARAGDTSAILPLICLMDEVTDLELRHRIAAALSRLSEAGPPHVIMAMFDPDTRPAPVRDFS
jgi:MFS family permease